MPTSRHEHWMQHAIKAARRAEKFGDRPFGAVIVDEENQIVSIAAGTGTDEDPLRHSECVAIEEACRLLKRGARRLEGCTLYSTHEPCHMCAGAILHAHLSEVVWGSWRDDLPELFRRYDVDTWKILYDSSHLPRATGGIMNDECVRLFDAERAELANARAGF